MKKRVAQKKRHWRRDGKFNWVLVNSVERAIVWSVKGFPKYRWCVQTGYDGPTWWSKGGKTLTLSVAKRRVERASHAQRRVSDG